MKEELSKEESTVFDILNCYEVDARNITNGITYLDSSDAKRLARQIIRELNERN